MEVHEESYLNEELFLTQNMMPRQSEDSFVNNIPDKIEQDFF